MLGAVELGLGARAGAVVQGGVDALLDTAAAQADDGARVELDGCGDGGVRLPLIGQEQDASAAHFAHRGNAAPREAAQGLPLVGRQVDTVQGWHGERLSSMDTTTMTEG